MKNDKILLIGSEGNMGSKHFRVLKELKKEYEFRLKRCDLKPGADYTDYKKAYEEFKPNKVIIATTTSTHSEILQYFNNKVYSIFVEKPIVDDGSEDYYMVTRTRIMVGHIERYNPMISKIRELVDGKKLTHIICLRCGFCQLIDGVIVEDSNIDKDLMIHDIDVAQYLTTHLKLLNNVRKTKSTIFTKIIENNQADMFTEINEVKCFFHADKTSPKKVRIIKVLGPEYILEGSYTDQTLFLNGKQIEIEKKEPLKVELEIFLKDAFEKYALKDAITNLKILKGEHIAYI